MQVKRALVVFATGLCLTAFQTKADINWLTGVADGYYNQATNWTGGIQPTNATIGYFTTSSINQDYLIRFPSGGLTENSVTKVGNLSSGRSITFDTRGTWWLKSGPDAWPTDWTGFQMTQSGTAHLFNLEGLISVAPANAYPIMLMSNAVFRFQWNSTGATNVLEEGLLNLYNPGGLTRASHSLITGSSGPRSVVLFRTNSTLRANIVRLRGNSNGHLMRFEGGTHEIYNGLVVTEGAAGAGVTNTVQVAGGSLFVRGGSLSVGAGKLGSHGILLVDGSGQMDVRNSASFGTGSTNLSATVYLRNAGQLTIGGEVRLGENVKTLANVSLTNTAFMGLGAALIIAYGNTSTSSVDIADNAALSVTGTVEVTRGSGALGTLKLRNNTTTYLGNTLSVGGSSGSSGSLALQDNAALTVKGSTIYIGNNSGTGRLDITGGALAATNTSLYFAGSLGSGLFSGGQTDFKYLEVSPSVNGQTNTLLITGGDHKLWDDASGALVGNGARTGILDMQGGQLTIPRFLRIGAGTTGSAALPCVKISGGRVVIVPNSGSENVVNVADSSDSRGRLELLGGTLKAQAVHGWTGSLLKGGTGWTEFYANGGTLVATNVLSSKNLLETFDKAELGSSGLTVDSAGADIVVNQNFTDASGVSGLFLKAGAGTLFASNSVHARTVIAQGGLRLLSAAATFGRSLVITNQATLSLVGSATNLTAGDLTLGTPDATSLLYLDGGDCITVTNSNGLTLGRCGLVFGGVNSNATYTLFRSTGSLDANVLTNLTLLNPTLAKSYSFAVVPSGANSAIQLTVGDYAISDAVWNGSQSADWNTATNWTPSAVPNFGSYAVFNGAAASKTVTLSAAAQCTYLRFDSAAPYLLQGAPLTIPAGGVSNVLGSHTIAMPLALAGSFSVQGALATTTTVSGTLSANTSTLLNKGGSGTLTVSGGNSGFNGTWSTAGGRLNFAAPDAWGSANSATDAVTVGAGTLAYSGAAATVGKGLALNPGGISNAAILEAQSDLTVSGPFSVLSGIFCKRGSATLTLNIGSSTATLSAGNGMGGININPAGTITLPDSGDSPATTSGLGGLNVLEGTLRVKGNGAGVSTANQNHFGIIGGTFNTCQANPTLELDAVRMNQGGAGLHLIVGNQMSASSSARTPTLRLVNGAALYADTVKIGYIPATTFAPALIMSNATLSTSWQINIGADNNTAPLVRLMQGSVATASGGSQWGGGIYVARNVDSVVAENSVLSQTGAGGSFRFSDYYSSGTMRWESGGTMQFTQFLGANYLTASGLNMIFNGGVMEPLASGESFSSAADKQSFVIEAGGLTLRTGSGIRHAFHFPFTGTGALTKTGAGEAVFAQGLNYTPNATNATGLATGNYTGGTAVQAGTLSVSNGTIRSDAAVAIAAGARLNLSGSAVTLGEVSGSGTVSNGVLYAGYRCHVASTNNDCVALADVTIPAAGLAVTFDPASGYALTNRQTLAVATRSGSTDLNLPAWKAKNVGVKLSATFTLIGNTVYANVFFTGGTLISIR